MNHGPSGYGLWALVVLNSAIFIMFALSFAHPQSKRDWRSFGAFSAFVVALFAEMYGFPLTIYFLAPYLQSRLPGVDLFSHDSGHLWYTLLGLGGNPHTSPIHILSNVLIIVGFLVVSSAWSVLYRAQREGRIATEGPYAYVRHPQYIGFVAVLTGFLLQWPTFVTLAMYPVLVWMYVRLAHREEKEVRVQLGPDYEAYALRVPAFFPLLSRPKPDKPGGSAPRSPRKIA